MRISDWSSDVCSSDLLIIRVPARRSPINNFAAERSTPRREIELPIVWKEKKAPKCVAMRDIVGMQVQRDSTDLITRQQQRLRVQLNRGCRALDFYAGFYMLGDRKSTRLNYSH